MSSKTDNKITFLEAVQQELYRYFNGSVEFIELLPLPGSGSTSERYLLKTRTQGKPYLFVCKQYQIRSKNESRRQARREYQALEFLKGLSSDLWDIPEPIGIRDEYATIIMRFCPGINLNEFFWGIIKRSVWSRKNIVVLQEILHDIALMLLDIQAFRPDQTYSYVATPDFYLNSFSAILADLDNFSVNQPILDAVERRFKDDVEKFFTDQCKAYQHTDLYLNNIIKENTRYHILDFPNFCFGSMYWDISHIVVSLEDYKIFKNVDISVIDACKKAFMQHFSLDFRLLHTMQLLHYCHSFNIRMRTQPSKIKKLFMRSIPEFYYERMEAILSDRIENR